MWNNTEGTISREIADKKKIVREASFEASNLIWHHLFWADDIWQHWLMSVSTGGHASHFSLKERGTESVKQHGSRTTRPFSSQKAWPDGLLMSVVVVADEWGTARTCREVNSSALTCEELHYTSITSLTHSFSSPPPGNAEQWKISLRQTGQEPWFNHGPVQKYITQSSLAFSEKFAVLMRVAIWWHFSQHFSLLFSLISKLRLHRQTRFFTEWEIIWQRINAIRGLIYMMSYRQICAADFWWNKTRSDSDADWSPYITLSIRHRCKQQTAIAFRSDAHPREQTKVIKHVSVTKRTQWTGRASKTKRPGSIFSSESSKKKCWYRVVVHWARLALACAGQAALISSVVGSGGTWPNFICSHLFAYVQADPTRNASRSSVHRLLFLFGFMIFCFSSCLLPIRWFSDGSTVRSLP